MRHGQSLRPRRPGVTLVETSLVLLVALSFLLAIFEYGRFLMLRQLTENAAREGARKAVAGTSVYTTAQIQSTVIQSLAGQPLLNSSGQALSASDIQVYRADPSTGNAMTDSLWTDAAFGEGIAVKITAKYKPMLPTFGFLPSTVNINTTAVMLSEAN